MILGIGTDILSLAHMRRVLADEPEVFLRKTFTGWEQLQAADRPDPVAYYATRFAAKEAVFKALNLPSDHVRLTEIEIRSGETGRPEVVLSGALAQASATGGIREVLVSLSWDDGWAVAYALAQT